MGHKEHTIEQVILGMPASAEEVPVRRVVTVKCRVTVGELDAWREGAHVARCSVSELVRRSVQAQLERQAVDVQPAADSGALDELLTRYRPGS